MFVRIDGRQITCCGHRREGEVLDLLVQAGLDNAAARKLMRKFLKIAPTE